MSKTKTVDVQTRTGTTTTNPNVPSFIQKPAENIAGRVNDLSMQGPGAFAPKTTATQQGLYDRAAGGFDAPDYGESDDLYRNGTVAGGGSPVSAGQVEGQSLLTGLDKYYNPFKDQVLNPVLSDYDEQSGMTRAGQAAEAARNGHAFQGSRYGIQEAQTEGQLARGRSATEGGLLKDLYTEGTRLSGEDAARRQSAMTSNQGANLTAATANQQNALAVQIANQNAEDARARGLAQNVDAGYDASRADYKLQADVAAQEAHQRDEQAQYPIEYVKQMGGLLQGLNPADYIGRTTNMNDVMTGTSTKKNTASAGDWFGDAATAAAANFKRA